MKTREEIRLVIRVLDDVVHGRLPTTFNAAQRFHCRILEESLFSHQDSSRAEIEFARDQHWRAVCDIGFAQEKRNLHRLHHAALCWLLDDPAGGDFVPQMLDVLTAAWHELQARAVDVATGELVEVL